LCRIEEAYEEERGGEGERERKRREVGAGRRRRHLTPASPTVDHERETERKKMIMTSQRAGLPGPSWAKR
jgi:hypothetical protein